MFPDPSGVNSPWIEIRNATTETLELEGFTIQAEGTTVERLVLPYLSIAAGKVALIWVTNRSVIVNDSTLQSSLLIPGLQKLLLYDPSGKLVDQFSVAYSTKINQSIARFPSPVSESIIYEGNEMSPGNVNPFPGYWRKVADRTSFSPRDSAPNAVLIFKNSVWVLSGWRFNATTNTWSSRSDVWRSDDGVNWTLVNDNPPYYAYSGFVVFKNKMWAFDVNKGFYSSDGKTWWEFRVDPELFSDRTPGVKFEGPRIIEFQNKLWAFYENKLWSSVDGFDWDLVSGNCPWGKRDYPGVLKFKNKLWYMGGGANYNTGHDYYPNDVWVSEDGLSWQQATSGAQWLGRHWASFQVANGKIWVMGGWNYYNRFGANYGNSNDVWYSEDGINWTQAVSPSIWKPRHASLSFNFKNALWISCGYGSGDTTTLYNDVWKLPNPTILVEQEALMYGDEVTTIQRAHSFAGTPLVYEMLDDRIVEKDGKLLAAGTGQAKVRIGPAEPNPFCNDTIISLAIDKRLLHVYAKDRERKFGTVDAPFEIQLDGLINGDSEASLDVIPQLATDATLTSPSGNYAISFQGFGSDDNYELRLHNGTLTITEAETIAVFPNPVSDFVTVAISNNNEAELQLFDSSGNLQLKSRFQNSDMVDIRHLPVGIYYYRMLQLHNEWTGKIIIRHAATD